MTVHQRGRPSRDGQPTLPHLFRYVAESRSTVQNDVKGRVHKVNENVHKMNAKKLTANDFIREAREGHA
jgi:hypothetical protein